MSAALERRAAAPWRGETIRVRGVVQGVGFRPAVWRLARELGICGEVCNDAAGVLIHAWGEDRALERFVAALPGTASPLAHVDSLERAPLEEPRETGEFTIAPSARGAASTGVVPDAATCPACVAETRDPVSRRYRYPFTNCTHCGPRLSIIERIPYDRAHTSMRAFAPCEACATEYASPADRRFHAQPVACHACGPRAWLARGDGAAICPDGLTRLDDVDAACTLLQRGEIVAVKGIGGFHLACDATCESAVRRLRERKARPGKPFALMARDLDVVRRYCRLGETERALLERPAAPIVLLEAHGEATVAPAVAPGQPSLGFMLPYTPLHHLMLRRMDRPVVMTSGNRRDEPQCTGNAEAVQRLGKIADWFLLHDRDIVNRLDDSVVRVAGGEARVLRAGRGLAPLRVALPAGFPAGASLIAMGAALKSTFCLVADGVATLSQHMGDLEDARTLDDYTGGLARYRALFEHRARAVVIDRHPEYQSARHGRDLAATAGATLVTVQHHHAHVAACLAENGVALDAKPVLGVALDGLGYGDGGALWGGEFLLADYRSYQRLGTFRPVAMPGGAQAVHEPWRSTYAHLMAEMGWARFWMNYRELELARDLEARPRTCLDAMVRDGRFAPLASSCGRLFDAVAGALGICRDRVHYEGEAAIALEAAVDRQALTGEPGSLDYPFSIPTLPGSRLPYVEPLGMWQALLGDRVLGTAPGVIAARFHRGLARVIAAMVERLAGDGDNGPRFTTVALSGGVFQNRVLLELLVPRLEGRGFRVLTHRRVPANDGGIALGQAAIGAAGLAARSPRGTAACV